MVDTSAISEATGTEQPGADPSDAFMFIIDDDICTRCALCVDRCPTGVIILGKLGDPAAAGAVIILPGPNGVLDTIPTDDDVIEFKRRNDAIGVDRTKRLTELLSGRQIDLDPVELDPFFRRKYAHTPRARCCLAIV